MWKWFAFIVSVLLLTVIHEGIHALTAVCFDEFRAIHLVPPGIEVVYITSIHEREGLKWALIAGGPNIATLCLGYLLLVVRHPLARVPNLLMKGIFYYTTLLALVMDPLNLAIGPFIYGGDVGGISVGLTFAPWIIQLVFGGLFLMNHELIAQVLLPAYGIVTDHFLVRPWFKVT
jgi:hypothetical protein